MARQFFTKDYGGQSFEKDAEPNLWTEEQISALSEAELFGLYTYIAIDEIEGGFANANPESFAKIFDDFTRLQANGELIQHLAEENINH